MSVMFSVIEPRYRGASLIRNSEAIGPYSRTMPSALRCPYGGGLFLVRERTPCTGIPLYLEDQGLGVEVWDLGFGIQGLGFRV